MTDVTKPKQQIRLLLRDIAGNKLVNNRYTFELAGYSTRQAEKYIHNMRVELSRLRGLLREQGGKAREFKILIDKIEELRDPAPGKVVVTLRYKDDSTSAEVPSNLAETLSLIADQPKSDQLNKNPLRGLVNVQAK